MRDEFGRGWKLPRRVRSRDRIGSLGTVALLCGLIASGLVVTARPAYAAPRYCAPEVVDVMWDGNTGDLLNVNVGDNRNWNDPYNWDLDCVPGSRYLEGTTTVPPGGYHNVVTIRPNANVFLNDGESAHVAALHNNGALTVTRATLETLGDSDSSTLTLLGAYLAGRDSFRVTSTLRLNRSTLTTRACHFAENGCASPPSQGGTLVIEQNARMEVDSYVNLKDQRVIENHGMVTLTGLGYIAADDGTALRNLGSSTSTGRFEINNDRGYYQGFTSADLVLKYGAGWADVGLSRFVNTGTVIKNGDGASLIAADYTDTDPSSPSSGQVEVLAGSLRIYTPNGQQTRTANVQGGSTFGDGGPPVGCGKDLKNDPSACDKVSPTKADPQVTSVLMTQNASTPLPVAIRELPPEAGVKGAPVEIETPGVVATNSQPLRFRIMLDFRKIGGKSANEVELARTIRVTRNLSKLPNCGTSQNPEDGKPSCVARRLSVNATKSLGNNDLVLVISSRQNSRYRVG